MLQFDATQVIADLYRLLQQDMRVDQTETGVWSGTGLLFSISAQWKKRTTYVHFILTSRDNWTYLWSYAGPERDPFRIQLQDWASINHDTEWRNSGIGNVLRRVYFEGCEKAQEHLPVEDRVAPELLRPFTWLGYIRRRVFDPVNIVFDRKNNTLIYLELDESRELRLIG